MSNISRTAQRPEPSQPRPTTSKVVFEGVLFEVWQWEQKLFDGDKRVFETLTRPDTVLVLPILDDGQIILGEETQPGVATKLHALGGRIESGESPEAAARRELLEESGYEAEELRLWDAWQPVNKIDWAVYLFVAHGLRLSTNRFRDAGERIVLRTMAVSTLLDRNSSLMIDDYELLHKVYFARSNHEEYQRVLKLLSSTPQSDHTT